MLCTKVAQSDKHMWNCPRLHEAHVTDEGAINIVRLEQALSRTDVKHCQVDVTTLAANETLTAHTWHPNGSLLVGSSIGKLFIVRKAAVELSKSHEMDAVSLSMFMLQPVLQDELSRWTAGAITGLHISGDKLSIVFECPDGKGGILLWISTNAFSPDDHQTGCTTTGQLPAQQSLKAVNLPMSRVIFSVLSPNRSRVAIVDDKAKILVLHTDIHPETAALTVACTAHSGCVIGIEPIQGMPATAGMLFATLDVTGVLRAFILESQARTNDGDITTKLTMLQVGIIQTGCAALAAHPVLPLLAIATETGQIYLIGAMEFTGFKGQGEDAERFGSECVQFSAHALHTGCKKVLVWSPDGAVLACLESSGQEIILLRRKPSPLQKDKHILAPQSRISTSYASLICWHQPTHGSPLLVVHHVQGHLSIIELPREAAAGSSVPIALQTVLRTTYRLMAPLADMRVLQAQSSDSHVCIIGAGVDYSIRKFRLSSERTRAKKSSSHTSPVATIEAENTQACCTCT